MKERKSTVIVTSYHRIDQNPVFGEDNIFIELMDEAAGPFIKIRQDSEYAETGSVLLELEELEDILEISKNMLKEVIEKK